MYVILIAYRLIRLIEYEAKRDYIFDRTVSDTALVTDANEESDGWAQSNKMKMVIPGKNFFDKNNPNSTKNVGFF